MESGPPTLVRPCLRRLYPLSNENADGDSIGNGGASAIGTITIHSGLVQPVSIYMLSTGPIQQWAGPAGVRWDDVVGYLNRLTPRQYKGIGK